MAESYHRLFTRLPRNVIALGLASLFNDASSKLIYPLFPLLPNGALGANN